MCGVLVVWQTTRPLVAWQHGSPPSVLVLFFYLIISSFSIISGIFETLSSCGLAALYMPACRCLQAGRAGEKRRKDI